MIGQKSRRKHGASEALRPAGDDRSFTWTPARSTQNHPLLTYHANHAGSPCMMTATFTTWRLSGKLLPGGLHANRTVQTAAAATTAIVTATAATTTTAEEDKLPALRDRFGVHPREQQRRGVDGASTPRGSNESACMPFNFQPKVRTRARGCHSSSYNPKGERSPPKKSRELDKMKNNPLEAH